MGASCPAPRGRRGDEGQLPTALGRGLGLTAGRKGDRMTVFNLIRYKLRWPDELPGLPSPHIQHLLGSRPRQ